ncbi:MAG TPA: PH domain-containing protein [Candidatus Saccharimonadales bacterium]|jgi:uncharacterized membrane protein YdbT with pleckstrin-like domain
MKPVRPRDLKLFEHDSSEKILGEIPRSNIGLLFIFLNALMLTGLLLVLLFFSTRYEANITSSLNMSEDLNLSGILAVVIMGVIILVFAGSILAGYVYSNSYIIITEQKLVLINTKGIFARRVSQLSIGDVQDISVDQNTFFSRLFNYGSINIETAGEQVNLIFSFAHSPNDNAKYIVDAHEQNLKLFGN